MPKIARMFFEGKEVVSLWWDGKKIWPTKITLRAKVAVAYHGPAANYLALEFTDPFQSDTPAGSIRVKKIGNRNVDFSVTRYSVYSGGVTLYFNTRIGEAATIGTPVVVEIN